MSLFPAAPQTTQYSSDCLFDTYSNRISCCRLHWSWLNLASFLHPLAALFSKTLCNYDQIPVKHGFYFDLLLAANKHFGFYCTGDSSGMIIALKLNCPVAVNSTALWLAYAKRTRANTVNWQYLHWCGYPGLLAGNSSHNSPSDCTFDLRQLGNTKCQHFVLDGASWCHRVECVSLWKSTQS